MGRNFNGIVLFLPAFIFSNLFKVIKNYKDIQEILFILNIFLSILFFYKLNKSLFENLKNNKEISFLSAVFYVFNVYFILFYFSYNLGGDFIIFYSSFLPLFLYFFLKGIRTFKFSYIIIISFISLFYSFLLNYEFLLFPILLLSLFLLLREIRLKLLNYKFYPCKLIRYLSLMLFFVISINAFWGIFFLKSILSRYTFESHIYKNFNGLFNMFSSITDLFSIFRNFYYKYSYFIQDEPIKNFGILYFYFNHFFIILGIFITFIIFTAIIKNGKELIGILFIYIVGIFMVCSAGRPFPELKFKILSALPFFNFISNSYIFFIFIIFSESILLGFGLYSIYEFCKKKFNVFLMRMFFIFIIFALIVIVYPFPLLMGSKIYGQRFKLKGHDGAMSVAIPNYYNKAADYFEKEKQGYNIIDLPIMPYYYGSFNWNIPFYGPSFMYILFRHSTFYSIPLDRRPQYSVYVSCQNHNFISFDKLCGLFSVKYIVIQKDENLPNYSKNFNRDIYLKSIPFGIYTYFLENNKNFKYIRKYGLLSIYSLNNEFYLKKIWASSALMLLKINDANSYENYYKYSSLVPFIISEPNYNLRKSIIFFRNNLKKSLFQLISKKNVKKGYFYFQNNIIHVSTFKLYHSPEINFKRINPTEYLIKVNNVRRDFFINLNEGFSHGWKIYPLPYVKCQERIFSNNNFFSKTLQILFLQPINEEYHFFVNGYANGWLINPSKITRLGRKYYCKDKKGSIDIEFEVIYRPQILIYLGTIISLITISFFISYLIYILIKGDKLKWK